MKDFLLWRRSKLEFRFQREEETRPEKQQKKV